MLTAIAALLWLSTAPRTAQAFPELVRAGYVNCASCHYNPTGGGLLTPYGRALSKEELSHGSFFFERAPEAPAPGVSSDETAPKEEDFLYGATKLPSWLALGGDVRALQTYVDSQNAVDARFFLMQLDLESRVEYRRLSLEGTVGWKDPGKNSTRPADSLVSHRHWLGLAAGPAGHEDRVQARAGRFYPAYGLSIPDHAAPTRSQLGFDENQETYNAELAYVDESVNIFATAILGRPDAVDMKKARGPALTVSVPFGTRAKLGISAASLIAAGADELQRQNMGGVFAAVGITPRHYVLLEVDATHSQAQQWGGADYTKLGWEFSQGAHVFLEQEYGRSAFLNPNAALESYTLGLQYFPRTHWEFLLEGGKQRTLAVSGRFDTVLWLLLHYYL